MAHALPGLLPGLLPLLWPLLRPLLRPLCPPLLLLRQSLLRPLPHHQLPPQPRHLPRIAGLKPLHSRRV